MRIIPIVKSAIDPGMTSEDFRGKAEKNKNHIATEKDRLARGIG
jgi:hypothetical protein